MIMPHYRGRRKSVSDLTQTTPVRLCVGSLEYQISLSEPSSADPTTHVRRGVEKMLFVYVRFFSFRG